MKRTPTGTIIPTVEVFIAGTNIKSISISTMGAIAIFQFLDTKTTPSAPNRAGRSWSNAGLRVGFSRRGVRGIIRITPIIMIIVVTIDETAIAMVERIDNDRIHVIFDLPQRAIAPGQSIVLYDGDTVVGGAVIE